MCVCVCVCVCDKTSSTNSFTFLVIFFPFRDAFDEFTILADSWRYSQQYSSGLFFVLIDIDEDGMDAFQQVWKYGAHNMT